MNGYIVFRGTEGRTGGRKKEKQDEEILIMQKNCGGKFKRTCMGTTATSSLFFIDHTSSARLGTLV